jgi:large subunit ribosomal protein L25
MAEFVEMVTQPRDTSGSQKARQLRRKGLVPAVVYGHKKATVSISLPTEELEKAIRHGARVLDLRTGNDVQKALIKEIQWDHLGKELLHVDFARVAADERVVVTVPVEVKGVAPGIAAGGVLDQPIHVLSVECLAIAVPDSIRVNVGELQLDAAIYVRDLMLPPGVKAMTDPDAIVVHVTAKQIEPEAAPAAAAAPVAETAEPEVIGRKAAPEEEEGEK